MGSSLIFLFNLQHFESYQFLLNSINGIFINSTGKTSRMMFWERTALLS